MFFRVLLPKINLRTEKLGRQTTVRKDSQYKLVNKYRYRVLES